MKKSRENRSSSTASKTVTDVLKGIIQHPVQNLLMKWNWKSALFSSSIRGTIFFITNLTAGIEAAVGASVLEFSYRIFSAGFFGSLTQAFRKVENRRRGMIAAIILLPVIQHTIELIVHWIGGTAEIQASILASIGFTVVSTSFNLFAMREGILIVGSGKQSLWSDLKMVPKVLVMYLIGLVTSILSVGKAVANTVSLSARTVVDLSDQPRFSKETVND